MTTALDRFSKQTKSYAKSRPQYPTEIYEFLCGVVPSTKVALDCGTGNGQVAIDLVGFFNTVHATDTSQKQIENAFQHDRVIYSASPAETISLADNFVDLITVAQAVHWFDLEKFYAEARRVLKPDGIIALWAYGFINARHPEINALFQKVGKEILADYWDDHVKKIWVGYDHLPFPFEEIIHPNWEMTFEWSKDEFISYIESWSAAQKYHDANGKSVIEDIYNELEHLWPESTEKHHFSTPLTSRVGRNNKNTREQI